MKGMKSTFKNHWLYVNLSSILMVTACSPSANAPGSSPALQNLAYGSYAGQTLPNYRAAQGYSHQNNCTAQMLKYAATSQQCSRSPNRYTQAKPQLGYGPSSYTPPLYNAPTAGLGAASYGALLDAVGDQSSSNAFATHSLPNSLRQTANAHPSLVTERLRVKDAAEGYIQARAAGLPTVELSGSLGVRDSTTFFEPGTVANGAGSNSITRSTASVEATLSQPLYQGGRVKALKRSAKAQVNAAEAQLKSTETDILLQTAEIYLEIIRNRKTLEIFGQRVTSLQEELRVSEQLLAHGEGTISDKALVKASLTNAQIEYAQAQSTLTTSESQYQLFVGHKPGNLLPLHSLFPPQSFAQAKVIAKTNNPQILGAMHALEVADQNVHVAKTDLRPSLSLDGSLRGSTGQSETIRRSTSAELALQLRVPIYSGGQEKSEIRQAKIARSIALQDVRTATMEVEQRIFQAWRELETAKLSVSLSHKQIAAANEAYESVKKGQQAGVTSISDVLLAGQNLSDAKLSLIDGENQQHVQTINVLAAIGSLDASSFNFLSQPTVLAAHAPTLLAPRR